MYPSGTSGLFCDEVGVLMYRLPVSVHLNVRKGVRGLQTGKFDVCGGLLLWPVACLGFCLRSVDRDCGMCRYVEMCVRIWIWSLQGLVGRNSGEGVLG